MGFFEFIISAIVCSCIASLFDVETSSTQSNTPDYHLMPYAGDVFGA